MMCLSNAYKNFNFIIIKNYRKQKFKCDKKKFGSENGSSICQKDLSNKTQKFHSFNNIYKYYVLKTILYP